VRKNYSNDGGGGSNELVNSIIPHSPLIYLPDEGTWAETWRKERKRYPTNGWGKYKITTDKGIVNRAR
jgi:hypothetical protein